MNTSAMVLAGMIAVGAAGCAGTTASPAATTDSDTVRLAVVAVEGMTWAANWGTPVQRALEGLAGVRKVTTRFDDAEFDVEYDTSAASPEALREAVKTAGFAAVVRERN